MGWMLALTATAGNVTQQEARQKAVAFLQERFPQTTLVQSAVHKAPRKGMTVSGEQAAYYVFNAENQKGFVIVSGDDRTEEILGFSDTGSFDAGKMPPAMKELLDSYAAQIQALSEMSESEATAAIAKMRKVKTATRNSISPLITTKWDQATPYWNKCPQFMKTENEEDGYDLAYTGCVATAMSQIMYFHKQPAQTLAEIPSYTFNVAGDNYNYSTVTMEAQPETTLDWAHMRETYTGAEDEVSINAVSTLMLYAGCSVKMQYGRNSSGAYTDDIPKGFKYFGYGSKVAYRNDYSQQDWDDLVYSELAADRPIIYNGTAGSGGGHSFICDGFEYGDYFHINWGWGGMGNGFFQLSILNPSASGIGGSSSSEGYNMKQNIIYNIIPGMATPDGSGEDPEPVEDALTVTNINVIGTTAEYPYWERDKASVGFSVYKRKTFSLNYSDHVGTQKKYDVGLALYDGTSYTMILNRGNYSTALPSATGSYWMFESSTESKNAKKILAGVTGKYKIVPMYQLEGSNEWKPMLESDRYYFEADIENTTMSFTTHPINNLKATKFEFEGKKKVGTKLQVNVTLQNDSPDRFFGNLYLWFGGQQIDEYGGYTTTIQAEVPAGESKVVTFNLTPANAGTQNVYVTYDDQDAKPVPGSGSVVIEAAEEQVETSKLSVEIEALDASEKVKDNTHGTIYDSSVRFKATITNKNTAEYNKYILAPLFICTWDAEKGKFAGSMVTYKQVTISVPAGESRDYYFDFDNLASGNVYSMNIYARNNVPMDEDASHVDNIVTPGTSKYYAIEPGIITWKGDGARKGYKPEEGFAIPADVAAVSLEGLNLSSITANANPNTLYFLGAGETVTGLENANVVKDNKAETIILKDGYDFYTPFTFNADNISYSRQFTQGHSTDASGWSTLCLPFAATSVKNTTDNKAIDWFHSKSDSGKNFWLMDFSAEDDGKVYFNYADEMLANHPYIVAVPDDHWGSSWDLRKKNIEFSASNVTVKPEASCITSGTNYVFVGTFVKSGLENILALNEEGNQFSSGASQEVDAFRGYYQLIRGSNSAAKSLSIFVDGNTPTGITEIDKMRNVENEQLYNLSGQQVRNAGKGIYIKNGKKIIK